MCEDNFLLEAFETSSPAARVLATQKALRWDFPSRAVKVPETGFLEPAFLANIDVMKVFVTIALEAGSFAHESYDTTEPALFIPKRL